MTEIKPYMCSCCNEVWSRENQKSIKLGKYELHLCPDCYHEYIISNNMVLEQIRAETEETIESYVCDKEENTMKAQGMLNAMRMTFEIIDKYKGDKE